MASPERATHVRDRSELDATVVVIKHTTSTMEIGGGRRWGPLVPRAPRGRGRKQYLFRERRGNGMLIKLNLRNYSCQEAALCALANSPCDVIHDVTCAVHFVAVDDDVMDCSAGNTTVNIETLSQV